MHTSSLERKTGWRLVALGWRGCCAGSDAAARRRQREPGIAPAIVDAVTELVALTVEQLGEVTGAAGLPPALVRDLQAMIDARAFPALRPYVEPPVRRIFPGISRLQ